MGTTAETTIVRRKDHKGGKVISLGILWSGIAFVSVLAIAQIISSSTANSATPPIERGAVMVSMSERSASQPSSPKIVAEAETLPLFLGSSSPAPVKEYASVWIKLERLTVSEASEERKVEIIVDFLDGLNYEMTTRGGVIVSKTTGDQISPSTLMCHLNGYIPEKPHLKANCPYL